MFAKLPILTDTPVCCFIQNSMSTRPQQMQRALSTSHMNYSSANSRTYAKPTSIQLRQNQLQWMFNRRKQKLLQTSVENFRLYNRIKTQKSQLAKFNKHASKMVGSRLKTEATEFTSGQCHVNIGSNANSTKKIELNFTDNIYLFNSQAERQHDENKENMEIANFIKKKQENIKRLIEQNTRKEWRRYHSTHAKMN